MGLLAMNPMEISEEALVAGDHIYTNRNKKTYYHHGIYIGNDRVIHLSKASSSKAAGEKDKCNHYPGETTTDAKSGVRMCCLKCFKRDGSLYLMEYDGGKRAALRTTRSSSKSEDADQVVKRAKQKLSEGKFEKYDLVLNNCESFAKFCKTGKHHISKQVVRAGILITLGVIVFVA